MAEKKQGLPVYALERAPRPADRETRMCARRADVAVRAKEEDA